MKRSSRISRKQLPLELWREDRYEPSEELREEVTKALADLLLEAMGAKAAAPASNEGGGNDSEDHG